jgi:hypothetical protein
VALTSFWKLKSLAGIKNFQELILFCSLRKFLGTKFLVGFDKFYRTYTLVVFKSFCGTQIFGRLCQIPGVLGPAKIFN